MAVSFNGKHLAKFIRPEEYEAIYPQVEMDFKSGVTFDPQPALQPVSYTHLTLPTTERV